ncbi:odorant receptor 94a-like [Zeugodacus cucurbitae]|uniref:odorant receptor 94a-like n=1 Tax=Zeugodacus cucurbitae TaxID=28588 RepID=UPI0010A74216|nr:odorant receptor 94a-like [Zeugodacus cucurbitae]
MAIDTMVNFRTIVRILTLSGLWRGMKGSRFERYSRYYQLFMHFIVTFGFILLLSLEIIYSDGLDHAIDVLKYLLVVMALGIKVLNAWYYTRQITEVMYEWENSELFVLRNDDEKQMWAKTQKTFRKLGMTSFGLGFNSAMCALLGVLLMGATEQPYALWMPTNWRDKYYWQMYIYQCLSMPFICFSNVTNDVFQAYLLLHLTLCFRVISMRLERLANAGADGAITAELMNDIKMHQRVKEMAISCEHIISLSMLTQITLTFLIICFIIYNLANANFREDPVHCLAMLQYALIVSLQMFLPCYYGNELTLESEKLSINLYSSDWTGMSAYNRRFIFHYMESLKKPLVLHAGSFFEIGIPIFAKAMNNAYSLLALLLNVNDDEQ